MKKFLIGLLLVCSISFVMALTNVDKQEIRGTSFNKNGGFENGLSSWAGSAPNKLYLESVNKRTGAYSGRLTGVSGDYAETVLFAIPIDSDYNASFWYSSVSATISAAIFDGSGSSVSGSTVSFPACASFCQAYIPSTRTSGDYKIRLTLGSSGTIYIDDLFIGNVDQANFSAGSSEVITEASHGRSIGHALTPVYFNGSSWTNAHAATEATLATHIILDVIDQNRFVLAQEGRFRVPGHGLSVGQYYFTSSSVAGQLVSVEPTTYSNPVLYTIDSNTIQVLNWRASSVGTLPIITTGDLTGLGPVGVSRGLGAVIGSGTILSVSNATAGASGLFTPTLWTDLLTANSTASSASLAASVAQGTAEAASSSAYNAQGTANSSSLAAYNAQGTATSSSTAANNAQQSADAAQGTANAASVVANATATTVNSATANQVSNTLVKRDSNGDASVNVLRLKNNSMEIGTIDPYGRTQIWNHGVNASLRLGSLSQDGDPTDVGSEGQVIYAQTDMLGNTISSASGNFMYTRIKGDRVGFYNSTSNVTGYIYRVDTSGLYFTNNSYVKTIEVLRTSGQIKTSGGIMFNTASTQPTCSVGIRGLTWIVQGGVGVADSLQVCIKNSSGTYAWQTVF